LLPTTRSPWKAGPMKLEEAARMAVSDAKLSVAHLKAPTIVETQDRRMQGWVRPALATTVVLVVALAAWFVVDRAGQIPVAVETEQPRFDSTQDGDAESSAVEAGYPASLERYPLIPSTMLQQGLPIAPLGIIASEVPGFGINVFGIGFFPSPGGEVGDTLAISIVNSPEPWQLELVFDGPLIRGNPSQVISRGDLTLVRWLESDTQLIELISRTIGFEQLVAFGEQPNVVMGRVDPPTGDAVLTTFATRYPHHPELAASAFVSKGVRTFDTTVKSRQNPDLDIEVRTFEGNGESEIEFQALVASSSERLEIRGYKPAVLAIDADKGVKYLVWEEIPHSSDANPTTPGNGVVGVLEAPIEVSDSELIAAAEDLVDTTPVAVDIVQPALDAHIRNLELEGFELLERVDDSVLFARRDRDDLEALCVDTVRNDIRDPGSRQCVLIEDLAGSPIAMTNFTSVNGLPILLALVSDDVVEIEEKGSSSRRPDGTVDGLGYYFQVFSPTVSDEFLVFGEGSEILADLAFPEFDEVVESIDMPGRFDIGDLDAAIDYLQLQGHDVVAVRDEPGAGRDIVFVTSDERFVCVLPVDLRREVDCLPIEIEERQIGAGYVRTRGDDIEGGERSILIYADSSVESFEPDHQLANSDPVFSTDARNGLRFFLTASYSPDVAIVALDADEEKLYEYFIMPDDLPQYTEKVLGQTLPIYQK
ncbi:MAG: hypothetical protein V3V01_19900, partial [Acidimicrobiales bacterium]